MDKFSDLIIVRLNPTHLKNCIALDAITLKAIWTKKQWERELSESNRLCYGIFHEKKLIAMSSGWIICDELHITVLAVDPIHRKKGLGKVILSTLLNKAQLKGAQKATLEVSSENTSANSLYKKLGFKLEGIRHKYYQNGSDALILWNYLNSKNSNN